MTRRIATAILLTVWATLLIAGAAAYFVTRSMLLANLDESLMQRAVALPEFTDAQGNRYLSQFPLEDDDRYVVRDAAGKSLSRLPTRARLKQDPDHAPRLIRAEFSEDGSRSVTLQAFGKSPENPAAALKPVIVTYRGSAEEFNQTMSALLWTLIGSGLAGGIIAAFATRTIARTAIRPVQATADLIGKIDERAMDQRIDAAKLPREFQPAAQRFNEMLERLQVAFARRRRFLADASHELRTPVAAMMTTLEVVLRRPRSETEYLKALRAALTDAKMMRSLVEALMNQARSEIDELEEPRERVDLAAMINEVVASVAALANQRDVHVDQDVDGAIVLNIQPSRLRSVLLNLVGNAIEHNRNGGRVQVIAQIRGGVEALRATLIVQDDGPGIAPEHAANVFEPFYRADGARNADGHLGLGLFLVKTHVHRMGGEISLKSEVGKGARFTISLPAAQNDASVTAKSQNTAEKLEEATRKGAGEIVMKLA